MNRFLFVTICCLLMTACDPARVYETSYDFPERYWLKDVQPAFQFEIPRSGKYNLYMTIRNESSFENANLYFTYYLSDSTGEVLASMLKSEFLFDGKTGKPFGSTVLGDIYDHELPMLNAFAFSHAGSYTLKYEQFTRQDSLQGVMSVGLRVERAD